MILLGELAPKKGPKCAISRSESQGLDRDTEDYVWSVDLHYGLIAFNKAVQKDYEISLAPMLRWGCARSNCFRQKLQQIGLHCMSARCHKALFESSIP